MELAHSIGNAMFGVGTVLRVSLYIIFNLKSTLDSGQIIKKIIPLEFKHSESYEEQNYKV